MSRLQHTTSTVNRIQWVATANSIPYTFCAEDVASGELCVPEMYFTHRDDMRDYAVGFESVAGPRLLSSQILEGR